MEEILINRTTKYYEALPILSEEDQHRKTLPPLTKNEWQKVLDQIGFNPGTFISQLYLTVGSGFVGPGYGTLRADTTSEAFSLVTYNLARQSTHKKYPSRYWPKGLLALINWGCAIVSCVDCTTDNLEVVRLDPHLYSERLRDWSRCFRLESASLYEWWERWLKGEELGVSDTLAFPRWGRYYELIPSEQERRRKRTKRAHPNQLAFDFDTDIE